MDLPRETPPIPLPEASAGTPLAPPLPSPTGPAVTSAVVPSSARIYTNSMAFLISTITHTAIFVVLALLTFSDQAVSILSLEVVESPSELEGDTEGDLQAVALERGTAAVTAPMASDVMEESEVTVETVSTQVDPSKLPVPRPETNDDRWVQNFDNWFQMAGPASSDELPQRGGGGAGAASNVAATMASAKAGSTPRLGDGANYYGIRADGKRFVFIVDASVSMYGPRWQSAVKELLDCLRGLPSNAEFYVIFFSNQTNLMFNQMPAEMEYARADLLTLQRVQEWILQVPMGRSTLPRDAIRYGLQMKPDAIFLLSDGEFRDSSLAYVRGQVQSAKHREEAMTPIHTIGLLSTMGFDTLVEIAQKTGGQFRQVRVPTQNWVGF